MAAISKHTLSERVTEQVEAAQPVCCPGALPLKASLSIMRTQRFVLCKELRMYGLNGDTCNAENAV